MSKLEAAMVDPDQADQMDAIIERYGEVQGRFEELDGYALDARAREVLAGLSFSQERMDGDVRLLSGLQRRDYDLPVPAPLLLGQQRDEGGFQRARAGAGQYFL